MSHPLRIALLLATPGSTWGGMERHTLELAQGLADNGHDVHVLADAGYRDAFIDVGHFHPIPVQYSRRHPWLGLRLRRLLRRIQPDITHAQGNKAAQMLGNVKRRRGSTRSVYVGTVHGTKSSHRAFARLDGAIAVSKEIGENLDHPNKTVIFNGITRKPHPDGHPSQDESSDADAQGTVAISTTFEVPQGRPLLVAAGRLEPVKGFDRLLTAWSETAGNGHLAILGDGSARPQLEKQIKQLGLSDSVTLPGYEMHVGGWLEKADLCVISSEREGFPYILVEALLSRCPVISTPVSGVGEWLPDDCIAGASTSEALAICLARALDRLPAVRESQQSAFDRAADSLTGEAMVRRTLAFYGHLAAATQDSDAKR